MESTMADEPPARTIRPHDAVSASSRLRQPLAEKSRPDTPAPNQSKTPSAARRVTFATANHANPSSELVAKRVSSRRAVRIAKEQELAALCHRRASLWADAIREGFDPDIARFVRDQAAAWHLLATNYARSATDASGGQADAH
jgi:hypothetical protein